VTQDGNAVLARLLIELEDVSAADLLEHSARVLRGLGVQRLQLYVADYAEEALRAVPWNGLSEEQEIRLSGSVPGRAYLTRTTIAAEGSEGPILWIPVFRRSENVGVLRVDLRSVDRRTRELMEAVARIIGTAVLAARRHSDVFELARGAKELNLAAAMQWDLLPLPTYREPHVEVAGRVEPAYDIGGDAFDFAANDHTMHLGVFDAMGHGLGATLLTTLAVGAYRFARRQRSALPEMAIELDRAVAEHGGGEAFVTAHLCRLDTETGSLAWLNAGHPIPVVIRNHTAHPLGSAPPTLPFGLGTRPTEEVTVPLQPEDIVLFYSDGVIEARPEGGPEFGTERFLDLATRHGDPDLDLVVLVRQILDAVKEHAAFELRDDATLVALRWRRVPG
jgi:serine phosphatase RsbU (regulator of sigma subunit)